MVRDCPKPLAALVDHTTPMTPSDTHAFVAQGLPECLQDVWDPEEVRLYCLGILEDVFSEDDETG